jgi:O-antigen/teichoic acid export membrane protein
LIGLIPVKTSRGSANTNEGLSIADRKTVFGFVTMTALYECTQILINNGDILLVTHFFDAGTAGQYAALALVGRVVYFVTWMFIMVLLPEVIQKRKYGESTRPLLLKYLTLVSLLSGSIVLLCFALPQVFIKVLFGAAYLNMAPLLGWYALATALFAMANLFTYYHLALDQFRPMFLTAFFGLLQIGLLYFWHPDLEAVLAVQIACMALLLGLQLVIYFRKSGRIQSIKPVRRQQPTIEPQ